MRAAASLLASRNLGPPRSQVARQAEPLAIRARGSLSPRGTAAVDVASTSTRALLSSHADPLPRCPRGRAGARTLLPTDPRVLADAVRGRDVLRHHRRAAGQIRVAPRPASSGRPSSSRCCGGCTWSARCRGSASPPSRRRGTPSWRWWRCRCGDCRPRRCGWRSPGWRWRTSAPTGRPAACPGAGCRTPSSTPRVGGACPTSAPPVSAWSWRCSAALLASAYARAVGAGRTRSLVALGGVALVTVVPLALPYDATATAQRDGRRGPGQRAGRRHRRARPLPPDHPTSTRPRPLGSPPTSRRADPRAGLRGVAGELHGHRPVRATRRCAPTSRRPSPPSTCRCWPASSSTAGRSTCSTRASSSTRSPARETATPSGIRCRSASTSRGAGSSAPTSRS